MKSGEKEKKDEIWGIARFLSEEGGLGEEGGGKKWQLEKKGEEKFVDIACSRGSRKEVLAGIPDQLVSPERS